MAGADNVQNRFNVRTFRPSDEDAVVALWSLTFPDDPEWNESRALIRQKLTTQPELFFVCLSFCPLKGERLVGTVIAGYDGVRGWVHKVASHPDFRGMGVARILMHTAEQALVKRGCVKLNLQVRSTNASAAEFYQSIGYQAEERISLGKRLGKEHE